MSKVLSAVNALVWGVPALAAIIGVGIYLSVCTGFAQITLFPQAMKRFLSAFFAKNRDKYGVSSYQALCTALGATVGTGNLIGVAGAICIGGPGSIFWMWVCGLLGMATKFAEATLAVRYRVMRNGEAVGGPMYMIQEGLGEKWRPLACLYAFLGVFAAFGVGNATQINAVVSGVNAAAVLFGGRETLLGNSLMGAILAVVLFKQMSGGSGRIGRTAERLVPLASLCYICLCAVLLLLRWRSIPGVFSLIIKGAFSPSAITGGMIGSFYSTLRTGCCRGVFTNEAGMGTASMAHAGARTDHPVQQGMMGILEVFIDTIVICSLTAFAILSSGTPIPYGTDSGGTLTVTAFTHVFGQWVSIFLTAALCCFAFATVLGWGLYGARCAQFLFPDAGWKLFSLFQCAAIVFGAVMRTEAVWSLAETMNGLMAIPNLIALAALSPELRRLTYEFKRKTGF